MKINVQIYRYLAMFQMRGVSGQKPNKVDYLTRQINGKLLSIDLLHFHIDNLSLKLIWNPVMPIGDYRSDWYNKLLHEKCKKKN